MLDFAVVGHDVYKRALNTVTSIKGPRAPALSIEQTDFELLVAVAGLDPTPRLKYVKWILTRLYRDPSSLAGALVGENGRSGLLRGLLLEFEAIKPKLPAHMRDIFQVRSLERLEEVLNLLRKDRYKASNLLRNNARPDEVMAATQIMEHDGLSVHAARCVEDVIVLTGSDDVFDSRGDRLYEALAKTGDVYVFVTDYGVYVGTLPREQGAKGLLFDGMGEPGMFEDALAAHRDVCWDSCPDIITLMCKIDPALPFDEEMEDVGPFIAALNQFPLVLHEDREIPEDLREQIFESPSLNAEALEILNEIG